MKKGWLLAAAMLVPLAGCVSFAEMKKGLNALEGQPLIVSLDVLGMPSSENAEGGNKIIHWVRKDTEHNIDISTTTSAPGSYQVPGAAGHYVQKDTVETLKTVTYSCDVSARVNPAGIVETFGYKGQLGGCDEYISRLNRYRKAHGIE